jgi:PhnB protein
MTTAPHFRPDGYGAVTPWIITPDTAALLEFLKAAFDAEELARIVNPDGTIGHAEARIGDSIVMAFDRPHRWPHTPAFIRLYVPDADRAQDQALAAGATEVTSVTALAFGDRVGRIRDPLGNIWWLQTHVEDVDPGELGRRWTDPEWVEAMTYVQDSLQAAKPGS